MHKHWKLVSSHKYEHEDFNCSVYYAMNTQTRGIGIIASKALILGDDKTHYRSDHDSYTIWSAGDIGVELYVGCEAIGLYKGEPNKVTIDGDVPMTPSECAKAYNETKNEEVTKMDNVTENAKAAVNEMKNFAIENSKLILKAKVGKQIKKKLREFIVSKTPLLLGGKIKSFLGYDITWIVITYGLAFGARMYVGKYASKIKIIAECLEAENIVAGITAAEDYVTPVLNAIGINKLIEEVQNSQADDDEENKLIQELQDSKN